MNKLTEEFFRKSSGVFTLPDVSVLLKGSDFSRHGLIKRAIADKEILNIRRGLYCLAPEFQKKPVSIFCVAEKIYGPSYVSMETALSYHGWIPEAVYTCTCASFGNSKEFETPLGLFTYKRVPQAIFMQGVERKTDGNNNSFLMASPAKALVDYVYVNKSANLLKIDDAVGSLRIDEDSLADVSVNELTTLLNNYINRRVRRFISSWIKQKQ